MWWEARASTEQRRGRAREVQALLLLGGCNASIVIVAATHSCPGDRFLRDCRKSSPGRWLMRLPPLVGSFLPCALGAAPTESPHCETSGLHNRIQIVDWLRKFAGSLPSCAGAHPYSASAMMEIAVRSTDVNKSLYIS